MDADKIKDFFIFHVEKMILVVVIGVTVLLVWQGLQLPDFMKKHQPEKLSADAIRVRGEIDDNHNQALLPERIPDFDILATANETQAPVDHVPYQLDQLLDPTKVADSSKRRVDPALSPPRHLRAIGVLSSMAVRAQKGTPYAIESLGAADELEKVEKKVIRKRPKRSRRGTMDDEEGMDSSSMLEEMMDEYEDSGMGDEMPFQMGGAAGSKRKFNAKYDFGYRPGPTRDFETELPQTPVPEIAWFIAGTAVLPHKEIYDSYESAFKEAAGNYNPSRRDTPAYYNFEVQRADVTEKRVDQLVDADWKPRFDRLMYTKRAAYLWSGFAKEMVPVDYRDEAITTWIPPVLLEDYARFALHPLIPMKSKKELDLQNVEGPVMRSPTEALWGPDEGAEGGEAGAPQPTLAGPVGGTFEDAVRTVSNDYGAMGRVGMFGAGIEDDPVDYKIMRFYDFVNPRDKNTPRPGRTYVYRLRFAVNDPNFPANPIYQPETKSLDAGAYQRVAALMAKAEQEGRREFQRWSVWSEPCDPVSLPSQEEYFAGPVTPSPVKIMNVNNRPIKVLTKQPSAKIVASHFDFTFKARIPMFMDVTEGSVLSGTKEFNDVVDPITLAVKKIPNAKIVSGTTVIGLDGGNPLTIAEGEGMTEPGVMLLYDADGGLTVTDEVSDQEYYRIFSFADERGE